MLRVGMTVVHPEYGVCTLINLHNNSAVIKTSANIEIPCFANDLREYVCS